MKLIFTNLLVVTLLSGCITGGNSTKVTLSKIESGASKVEVLHSVNSGHLVERDLIYIAYCYTNSTVDLWSPNIVINHQYKMLKTKIKQQSVDKQNIFSEAIVPRGSGKYLVLLTGKKNSEQDYFFDAVRLFELGMNGYRLKEARSLTELDTRSISY